MTMQADGSLSALERGRAALSRGAWDDAVSWLRAAVDADPADPDAWESFANACVWVEDLEREIEARQRAYSLFREQGDDLASARVSLDLAWDFLEIRGEMAVGNGWFQRARRLLSDLPPAAEHALLGIWEAYLVLDVDPVQAEVHARRAVAIADEVGAHDIGVLSRSLHGQTLAFLGDLKHGMSLLDEAIAGAIGREISDPQWFYFACCCMIDTCDKVRDYGRSLQWCDQLREFAERWRVQAFLTSCRIKYTGALLWRGDWSRAEAQLERAIEELGDTRPAVASGAIVRLAELRRRQGRTADAEMLLKRTESHPAALLVRAALALDRGDAASALEPLDVLMRRTPTTYKTERISLLEKMARARTALGQLDHAQATVEELRGIVELFGTDGLRGTLAEAQGLVAAGGREYERSRQLFEEAIFLYESSGSPYEAARVRIELADSLAVLARASAAVNEASTALSTLEKLGAEPDANRARRLLAQIRAEAERSIEGRLRGSGARDGSSVLTRRQQEILALGSQGMSDRDIGGRLFLSEHTVHRHVANILGRLGVSTRTAAVALALRDQLLAGS